MFTRDNTENSVLIISDGVVKGAAGISDNLYSSLYKDFRNKLPDMRKDEPFIDQDYAIRKFTEQAT